MTSENKQAESTHSADTGTGKQQTAKNGAGFWVSLMAMLGFILGANAFYQDTFATKSAKGIYVVDGERLAYSYIAQAEAKRNQLLGTDAAENADYQARLQEIENELATNLSKIHTRIRQMSANGMVVVQRSSVLAYPQQADMTAKIASELGISLAAEPTAQLPPAANRTVGVPETMPPQPASGEGKELD